MNFGDKLLQLRKEKGLSQEALAEKLNTSRQAISKWENNQGFPETDKLIIIGNIFDVSIDYLLKESNENNNNKQEGYYVSKDMAEGFLLNSQKTANHVAIGFGLFVLAFEPYFLFGTSSLLGVLLIIIIATLGIISFVTLGFAQDQYAVLKQEVLLFDSHLLKDLTTKYEKFKRKQLVPTIFGACLLAIGFLAFALEKKLEMGVLDPYYPVFVLIISIGLTLSIRIVTIASAYQLLIHNKEHTNRVRFKLIKKLKKKFDEY